MASSSFPFDDAPIGLCIVRRGRKTLEILEANETFKTMAGKNVVGKSLEDIAYTKEAKDFCKALKSPNVPASGMIAQQDYWFKVFTQLDGDRILLYTAPINDLQAAVSDANDQVMQKSNFLATMSHEMRTPMQSVFGLLEMIELEKPQADILSMVRTAKQSASGMLELLDTVLDFAKADADQMELDLFEVPVRTLCRGIVEALEVKIHGKDVQLIDTVDSSVPFVIVGDPKRLRQILINLTGNALKFTKEGRINIHVTTNVEHIKASKNGVALRFEITDTGIGMSEEVAARLFQPFMQADNTTARKYGGTGLGLSICKKLVELMGGQIGVTSIEEQGSTFWFEIPTEEVDVNAQILDLPVLDGISVLSVEGHPMGAKEIQKSLRSMGATVEHCATIKDALALIKRRPFDVGIFDQGLPDGLGVDLLRQTLDLRPFMGLIMYTARDDLGLQHTLNAMGVTYLTKPASRMGLGEAVLDAAAKVQKMDIGNGTKRLIVAEDTASVRDVLRRQLEKLGVDATFVDNGIEALRAVRTGDYGILFTDLHMPEMDGYALVQQIRGDDERLDRHFPIIALTADVQMAQRQVYMEHGFDECLLKPVTMGHFQRLLIRWGLLKDVNEPKIKIQKRAQDPALHSAIDKEAVIAQMGAFDQDVIEMLKLFVDMTIPLITVIETAHAESDQHTLKEAAHSLKGAARSACANKLGNLAASLQDEVEAQRNVDALIPQIRQSFQELQQEVASL